ncbi:MAG: sugar-binding protein, partial [Acidobacteriota bacterium]
MNASVKMIALLLVLLGGISLAQFPPVIDGRKDFFYSRLADAGHGYLHISHTDFIALSGPAPESEADLSADVWMAWDETYFYLYAEVKDDIVSVSSPVRPWNDCIELKFDPDPGRKPLTGIVNARLSALDRADADDERGVDNLYPEMDSLLSSSAADPSNYARRKTSGGYALELRLKWDWIRCRDRSMHPGVGRVFGLAISVHDNDGATGRLGVMEREATIQWSAGMADEVWLVPQLLGTVEFAPGHQLKCLKRNAIDTTDVRAKTFLSLVRFTFRKPFPIAIEKWRYHPGDDPEWAKPEYDDRAWSITYPRITDKQKPEDGWNGIGWFRALLVVDSSLKAMPLGFGLSQTGAAEVYVDGTLLGRYGTVGTSGRDEVKYLDRNLTPLVFKDAGIHLVAVRYSNFSTGYFNTVSVDAGFRCIVFENLRMQSAELSEMIRAATLFQALFTLLPLVIGAVHLFFFFFYPRGRENLYFAIFLFCWAYIVFTDYQSVFATDLALHIMMGRIVAFAIAGGIVFGMLTVYSGMYEKLPVQFYALAAAAAAAAAWNFISPNVLLAMFSLYCIMGLTALEVLRVFLLQWRSG